jgi:hypothetical protein
VVSFPKIYLSDCSSDTIVGYNGLDSVARCVVGAAAALVPPPLPPNIKWLTSSQAIAEGALPPKSKGTAIVVGIIAGAVGLLVIAIAAGILVRNNADPQARA